MLRTKIIPKFLQKGKEQSQPGDIQWTPKGMALSLSTENWYLANNG
jgi:hypothetical protein